LKSTFLIKYKFANRDLMEEKKRFQAELHREEASHLLNMLNVKKAGEERDLKRGVVTSSSVRKDVTCKFPKCFKDFGSQTELFRHFEEEHKNEATSFRY